MYDLPPLEENDVCPSCKQGVMKKRESQYGEFLGCNRFPICAYKRNIKKRIDTLEEAANKILEEE